MKNIWINKYIKDKIQDLIKCVYLEKLRKSYNEFEGKSILDFIHIKEQDVWKM